MRTSRIRIAAVAGATTALALGFTAYANSATDSGAQTHQSTGTVAHAAPYTSAGSVQQAAGQVVASEGHAPSATGQQVAVASAKKTVTVAKKTVTVAKKKPATRATSVRQCSGDEISYDVLHRFPKQLGEHLLVTAMNADSKPCWVTASPSVMLGDTVNVLPHSKKDAPGGTARITLKPGAKVYSAVNLFADGKKKRTSTELSLALRDQGGDTGPAVELNAFTSKGAVSKFTWSSADVTNWNTAKPYDF
ncbi:DUF4232 domain-containing protein [Streptomyces sp. AC536]|uniref:DUF4232 domain-containing protein n=1 Tax=Streptomyces buecherae TaxID=2763006 RepID=UPI00164CF061|nr:DUF4232 domain-containing protein [Streptomyces buecherae]MBC3986586.1 DUF4232 domain-containing protein [Streptomyces buecherae]QNJ39950.1 DUF4232 domain-containing protein [Streptomyces buecherae]